MLKFSGYSSSSSGLDTDALRRTKIQQVPSLYTDRAHLSRRGIEQRSCDSVSADREKTHASTQATPHRTTRSLETSPPDQAEEEIERKDSERNEPRGSPEVLTAFKSLPTHGIPHITVYVAASCVLHWYSSQGIHRWDRQTE